MNRARLLICVLGVVTFAALTVYETGSISRRRQEAATLEISLRETEAQLAVLRATRERNLQDIAAARQQLGDLTALIKPALAASEAEREAEVKAWLGRVKKLRELLAQNSGQQIPELSMLTEADWLRVSRKIALDDEDHRREALAKVRAIGKEKFARDLARALTKFTAAHAGQLPVDLIELATYLSPPADPAMLHRYALTEAGRAAATADGKISAADPSKPILAIQEKAALDADYDTRTYILSNGGFSSQPGPEGWIDNYNDRRSQASEAYKQANHGAVSLRLADLIPYMNPPLPPATAEKLLKAEQKRSGVPAIISSSYKKVQ